MKPGLAKTEKLLRKTAGRIKEGKKKVVARIPMKMKGRKTEENKEALERLKIER